MAQEKERNPRQTVSTVKVGAYISDVQALDLNEHSYAVDIYIWFRWSDPELNPVDTFEFINPNELWGHMSVPLYEEPIQMPNGDLYQVLRVQGRFSRKFFFNNYPYDRQQLIVMFEDSVHEINRLVYVPDRDPVSRNPNLLLPGFKVGQPNLVIASFHYPTTFGDTRRTEPHTYSRVRIELPITRPIVTSSLKFLLPLICVVIGASLMLLLKVTLIDARLGIGITALLTVVAIQLAANETIPSVDYLVLMDKIHLAAYVYVLGGLTVVLYTVRLVLSERVEEAEKIQRRSLYFLSSAFLIVMTLLVSWAILVG